MAVMTNNFLLMIYYLFDNNLPIYMNKQKLNRKKLNKFFYILLMAFILFLPLTCAWKFAKHYLYDTTYQNISEVWLATR